MKSCASAVCLVCCSMKHVPGFIEKSGELKSKGVDEILCISCVFPSIFSRRATAAAASATAATSMAAAADPQLPVLNIKVQQQNKQKISKLGRGQYSKFKKRSKVSASTAAGSSSSSSSSSSINVPKKLNFEDFVIKLSKNLSFQRVFPQNEKDAAILLMALSSGLVHG